MEKHNLSQLSLTDPDSKLMKSKNGYIVSYNVQMTVDSESQILSTICMTNNPTDMSLIYRTLKGLKARYPNQILHVTADKGYTWAFRIHRPGFCADLPWHLCSPDPSGDGHDRDQQHPSWVPGRFWYAHEHGQLPEPEGRAENGG